MHSDIFSATLLCNLKYLQRQQFSGKINISEPIRFCPSQFLDSPLNLRDEQIIQKLLKNCVCQNLVEKASRIVGRGMQLRIEYIYETFYFKAVATETSSRLGSIASALQYLSFVERV